ncbi:MAG TPA: peptidoglycan-binding domain-containing protein [Bryobacteraceae bacterium]|nr:peptidoglycan-binding domain-containing protein [Bryobacteraceae bacterium]
MSTARRYGKNRWIVLAIALMLACLLVALPALAVQDQKETESVALITGLDRGTYEPYNPGVIEQVQAVLKKNGLYQGDVNGGLDEPTMKAIGEFQKANNLTVSGVPSPATRRLLLEE